MRAWARWPQYIRLARAAGLDVLGAADFNKLAGAVLAGIRRRLDNPRLVLVYLALVPTLIQIEPELSSYLTTLIQRSLVFLVVFALLTHTKNAGLRYQRTRP